MKRILLLTVMALGVASMAMAQANVGSIGIFADQTGADCNVTDVGGLVSAYVVHVNGAQANTLQFRVGTDAGVNMTFVSGTVNPAHLSLGDFATGITVTYVGCKTNFPILVGTLTYFGTGTTTSCEKLRILPDPVGTTGGASVEIVSCEPVIYAIGPEGGSAMVNTTGDCGCDIATEETTWSRIKSLYQ